MIVAYQRRINGRHWSIEVRPVDDLGVHIASVCRVDKVPLDDLPADACLTPDGAAGRFVGTSSSSQVATVSTCWTFTGDAGDAEAWINATMDANP